jgi:outer membrane protein assembly factor BamB
MRGGTPLWSAKLGKAGAPGWGGYAGVRGTPTVDGELLFAIGTYGEIVAFEAATGKELWRRDFTKDFGAEMPDWGFSESPLVDGNQVVMTPGGAKGAIVALNKRTGETCGRRRFFDRPILLLVPRSREAQYVQLTMAGVVGVAPDGKRRPHGAGGHPHSRR